MPTLVFTDVASAQLAELERSKGLKKRLKAVRSALGKMETNLRHPSLNTHEFTSKTCPHNDKLWESYAENNTPAAYRIFWCYNPPPPKDVLLIIAITPHP